MMALVFHFASFPGSVVIKPVACVLDFPSTSVQLDVEEGGDMIYFEIESSFFLERCISLVDNIDVDNVNKCSKWSSSHGDS